MALNGSPNGSSKGFFGSFNDVWLIDGVRTPMVDYCGEFSAISATDLGIKVGREVLKRCGIPGADIGSVIAGNMAPSDCHQFMLPRLIGLYSGVPVDVPAIMVQRICGTGFELFRQVGDQIERGYCDCALVVGTESMTRNPIAAFDHRTGFKLGAPVGFKDFMWEALVDPAPNIDMIQTAENLAVKYGITRAEVDAFAARSFARALAAQEAGYFDGEIVPVTQETFALDGYSDRSFDLPRKVASVARDTHPRPSPAEVLAKLKPVAGGLDMDNLNVHGGAIALGHPLACTGVRLTITVARQLRESNLRYGISSACVGGGQGMALLIENPDFR